MVADYFKKLSDITTKKIKELNDNNFVDFYDYSEELEMSFYFAYFLLMEEKMINVDKNNNDIKTRYTLNINKEIADKLVKPDLMWYDQKPYNPNPVILCDEGDYSSAWFLNTLRNSMLHAMISNINFDNKCVDIKNNHKLNSLEASVPFIWFKNFLNKCYYGKLFETTDTPHAFFDSKLCYLRKFLKDKNIGQITEDTLKKMLALSNPTYIELKSSFPLNITYQKLLDYVMFCDRLVENALNKKDIVSIKKIGFSVDEYNIYVNSLTKKYKEKFKDMDLYDIYIYSNLFSIILDREIKKKYPGVDVKVDYKLNYSPEDLDQLIKSKNILTMETYEKQIRCFYDFFNEKNSLTIGDGYFDVIRQFLNKIYIFSSHVKENCEEYLSREELQRVFNGTSKDRLEIQFKLLKCIQNNGSINDFDKKEYKNGLFWLLEGDFKAMDLGTNFFSDDQNIKNEIINDIKSNKKQHPKEVDYYKQKYSYFWEKYEKKLENINYPSDDVLMEYLKNYNVFRLKSDCDELRDRKYAFIMCFLYTLGINLYVFNKESFFDSNSSIMNYSFIDELNIDAYSTKSYNEYLGMNDRILHLSRILRSKSNVYEKCKSNPHFPSDKLEEFLKDIHSMRDEINNLSNKICFTKVKTIGDQKLAVEKNNAKIADVIRNCLSHNGRIMINEKIGDNLKIRLTDYSDDGKISSYIDTTFDDIMKFINNDIFYNILSQEETKEEEKVVGTSYS